MPDTKNIKGSEAPDASKIEIEGRFKLALELLERTNKNLFIIGKAGIWNEGERYYSSQNEKCN